MIIKQSTSSAQPPSSNLLLAQQQSANPETPTQSDQPMISGDWAQSVSPYAHFAMPEQPGPTQIAAVEPVIQCRNRGAAARFRERRKEQETQRLSILASLETRVREAEEEREYYKTQCDHFRNLVLGETTSSTIMVGSESTRSETVVPNLISKIPDRTVEGAESSGLASCASQGHEGRSCTETDEEIQGLKGRVLAWRDLYAFNRKERDYFRDLVMAIPEKRELVECRPLFPVESVEGDLRDDGYVLVEAIN